MSDPTALSAFAHRFTDLLNQGDFDTAINDLHADDAVKEVVYRWATAAKAGTLRKTSWSREPLATGALWRALEAGADVSARDGVGAGDGGCDGGGAAGRD